MRITNSKKHKFLKGAIAVLLIYGIFYSIGEYSGMYHISDLSRFKNQAFQVIDSFFGDVPAPTEAVLSDEKLRVHMIDVGQGSSALIQAGDSNVLIDSGENSYGGSVLSFLKEHDVEKLDMIIVTHPHSDHMGSMSFIIDSLPVGKVIVSKIPDKIMPTSKAYAKFLSSVKKQGLKLTLAKPGDSYSLSGDVSMEILGPAKEFDTLNNNSVVCRVTCGDISFFMEGDAEEQAELDLVLRDVELKSTVYFAGHHGSDTSTNPDYLHWISPLVSAVSVGDDNSYGHPSPSVVETLCEYGTMYRTDINGNISFITDGSCLKVIPEHGVGITVE